MLLCQKAKILIASVVQGPNISSSFHAVRTWFCTFTQTPFKDAFFILSDLFQHNHALTKLFFVLSLCQKHANTTKSHRSNATAFCLLAFIHFSTDQRQVQPSKIQLKQKQLQYIGKRLRTNRSYELQIQVSQKSNLSHCQQPRFKRMGGSFNSHPFPVGFWMLCVVSLKLPVPPNISSDSFLPAHTSLGDTGTNGSVQLFS